VAQVIDVDKRGAEADIARAVHPFLHPEAIEDSGRQIAVAVSL